MKPQFANAYDNIGSVLKEVGNLTEARAAYEKALDLDPWSAGVYFNYSQVVTFSPAAPRLQAMQAMRGADERLTDDERIQLDFALGKAYADIEDYKSSFVHLLRGNALQRSRVEYDETLVADRFARMRRVFTPKQLRRMEELRGGDPSQTPIFVLGMPRSGTTLIEQILASHPQVFGAGELRAFCAVADACGGEHAPLPYPDYMQALGRSALTEIGARYIAEVRKLAPDTPFITDKMPANYYYIGLIHLALPNAKIIHVMRDPVDTCLSCFSKLFNDELNYTYDLGELGRYYARYYKLMAHWRRVLPKRRILDVRYEDLVDDVEGETRRISAHCGLPWDASCLAFHETKRSVRTASAAQVRKPIYKSAVGRWHAYGSALEPLLRELNLQ